MARPKQAHAELTQARLKELLHYDPATGIFTWLCDRGGRAHAGDVAGAISVGYRRPMVDGRRYLASRLAWFYMKGVWPSGDIDHKDRTPLNDRWDNLRPATKKQNGENRKVHKNSTTGVRGVAWDSRLSKYRAQITHNKRNHFLGIHGTIIDAVAARLGAERKFYTHAPSTVR
jgi:hypothetical protein